MTKFIPGHPEACKRLFSIELLDDEEDDGEPTLSLATLTGIQPTTGRTMPVSVAIGSTSLCALLDFDSTHNFIDTSAADSSGSAGLRVAVANGDHIPSPGRCLSLLIDIADEKFDICCYSLVLGSFDMVLGVQWLESLGLDLWDFGCRTLAFIRNARQVLWSAATTTASTPTLTTTSPDMMEELLQHYGGLFSTS
jgi:hypothetical protein